MRLKFRSFKNIFYQRKINMKKQAILIHGGEAWETDEEYVDFLRGVKLENPVAEQSKKWKDSFATDIGDGFHLITPQMPCAWNAKYDEWKIWFEKHIPYIHDDVVLIGNSLGGVFLAKYLSENIFSRKIKQLHLLAAPFGVKGSSFVLNGSLEKIEQQVSDIHLYQSKDDSFVDFGDFEAYAKVLLSAKKHIFGNRGHFQVEEFPELVNEIVK